jgi:hypothetical protein
VAGRDHRLVHFGGYALVLVSVPPEFDVQLSARLARERYGAQLSVAWSEGDDRLVLGSDDVTGRRALDLSSMAEHLASKFEWVDALPDDDHVARVRVRDFATRPERGDEVVGEIAMGRAILEG